MELQDIILFETALDHLTGEELGYILNILNDLPEVLDAILLQGMGKKNRPCYLLQVLCHPQHEVTVRDAIFHHTHTLGLRRSFLQRYILDRHATTVTVKNESIRGKAHLLDKRAYVRPEADELAKLAEKYDIGMPGLRFESWDKGKS